MKLRIASPKDNKPQKAKLSLDEKRKLQEYVSKQNFKTQR